MSIVEDSYYDHDEHGLVKVVAIREHKVLLEKQSEQTVIDGVTIPSGEKEPITDFKENADPADVTASADKAEFDLFGMEA